MKRGLVRQVHRLLLSTATVECRPVSFFNDGGVRGMATTTEILLASSKTQERVAETATRAPPYSAAKPRWYRPDPVTGTWLPEAESEGEETSVTKSVIPPALTARIRAESTDSTQDKRWWTSMEELPDMDRPN